MLMETWCAESREEGEGGRWGCDRLSKIGLRKPRAWGERDDGTMGSGDGPGDGGSCGRVVVVWWVVVWWVVVWWGVGGVGHTHQGAAAVEGAGREPRCAARDVNMSTLVGPNQAPAEDEVGERCGQDGDADRHSTDGPGLELGNCISRWWHATATNNENSYCTVYTPALKLANRGCPEVRGSTYKAGGSPFQGAVTTKNK